MMLNATLCREDVYLREPYISCQTCFQRAAQIRSTPFLGESSSDSSDNDDVIDVTMEPGQVAETTVSVAGPSNVKTTPTVRVRKQVNQTSSGATKRGERLLQEPLSEL